MRCWRSMLMLMIMMMVMMVMIVLTLNGAAHGDRFMELALDDDVNLAGLNAAAVTLVTRNSAPEVQRSSGSL